MPNWRSVTDLARRLMVSAMLPLTLAGSGLHVLPARSQPATTEVIEEPTENTPTTAVKSVLPAPSAMLPGTTNGLGARIQRTMTLLAASDAEWHPPVRILCYGQSIIAQKHVPDAIAAFVKERYPHARLSIDTPAIGSYEAGQLVRTARQDIAPCYPDLVILHVYSGGAAGELERIVSDIRRTTTAEILLWTHHLSAYGPDGTARDAGEDQQSNVLRRIANQYGCELVDVREAWRAHLAANPQLTRRDLLADNIHLNAAGGRLLVDTVLRHFAFSTSGPETGWFDTVRTYEVRRPLEERSDEIILGAGWKRIGTGAGTSGSPEAKPADTALQLRFQGNRVVAWLPALKKDKPGTARVLIDGKPPSAWPEAYAVTRVGCCGIGWYPVINRILPGGSPVAEKWTIRFRDVSPTGGAYTFSVRGSITGEDGEGNEKSGDFVSKSGRLRFSTRNVSLGMTARIHKKELPATFEVECETQLMGSDIISNPSGDGAEQVPVVLIQGIPNTTHQLEIIPVGDGTIALSEIIVNRPPLR